MFDTKKIIISVVIIFLFAWNISLQIKSNNLTQQIRNIENTSEYTEEKAVFNEELVIKTSASIEENIEEIENQILNLESKITINENITTANYLLLKEYAEGLNKRQNEHIYEVIKIYHP